MLNFSADPELAEKQMRAIIFYLTTFGYIDGDFDAAEKSFVRNYIEKLVAHRVKTGAGELGARSAARARRQVHRALPRSLRGHRHRGEGAVHRGRGRATRSTTTSCTRKLKLRCFEIFQGFDRAEPGSS